METPPAEKEAPPTILSVMDDFWRLAFLPFDLGWSTWLEVLWPCYLGTAQNAAVPCDHQLVVPEPIEVEGEHALFA